MQVHPWQPSGIVTLLTDFGHADTYVGVMKGVLFGRAKGLQQVVDLTHNVPPQDVAAAGFHLEQAWPWFPEGTVHVAVVDPGVGSSRRILCASHAGQAFLAPDNGLLTPIIQRGAELRDLDLERFALDNRSATFHGRDVFCPAAAELVGGLDPLQAGARVQNGLCLENQRPADLDGGGWRGQVELVDHFGNLVTNLPSSLLGGDPLSFSVELDGHRLPIRKTYAEVASGELVALIDSFGRVEVARRDGNASRSLGLEAGAELLLRKQR